MARVRSALAVVVALLASPALAQQAPMSEDLAWKLLELGRVIDPPKTAALYAPMQEKEPYSGVKVERDVKYGSAERHLLDVFTPEAHSAARPVLIYIHGGGFVAGNRRSPPGAPFYDNIMLWAAKNGFVGVNATYRLAPASPWPAGAEDLAAVVQWVSKEITGRGGDPARIFLMGQSAGAVHVASYVSHPEFHKVKGGGLAGVIMVSGIYDLTASPAGDAEIAYFGSDPSRYAERSSLQGLAATPNPADGHCGRTRPAPLHRTIRSGETGHLQTPGRMRSHLHAAAAQPHVGSVCDQHRGYAFDRRDSGIREDGEIAGVTTRRAPSAAKRRYTWRHESRRNRRSRCQAAAG
jgi:acetyl esterase/lipase